MDRDQYRNYENGGRHRDFNRTQSDDIVTSIGQLIEATQFLFENAPAPVAICASGAAIGSFTYRSLTSEAGAPAASRMNRHGRRTRSDNIVATKRSTEGEATAAAVGIAGVAVAYLAYRAFTSDPDEEDK